MNNDKIHGGSVDVSMVEDQAEEGLPVSEKKVDEEDEQEVEPEETMPGTYKSLLAPALAYLKKKRYQKSDAELVVLESKAQVILAQLATRKGSVLQVVNLQSALCSLEKRFTSTFPSTPSDVITHIERLREIEVGFLSARRYSASEQEELNTVGDKILKLYMNLERRLLTLEAVDTADVLKTTFALPIEIPSEISSPSDKFTYTTALDNISQLTEPLLHSYETTLGALLQLGYDDYGEHFKVRTPDVESLKQSKLMFEEAVKELRETAQRAIKDKANERAAWKRHVEFLNDDLDLAGPFPTMPLRSAPNEGVERTRRDYSRVVPLEAVSSRSHLG